MCAFAFFFDTYINKGGSGCVSQCIIPLLIDAKKGKNFGTHKFNVNKYVHTYVHTCVPILCFLNKYCTVGIVIQIEF